jgi:hypothetical protein
MTIAVSAVVASSRMLMALTGIAFSVAIYLLVLLGFGSAYVFPIYLRILWLLGGILLGLVGIRRIIASRKSLHIDISGNGQITVEEDNAMAMMSGQYCSQVGDSGCRGVRLLPGSTIWPFLMVLRLQAEDRTIRNVVVLPDSVSPGNFRKLAVACRWIAAHNDQAERKIL